MEWMGHEDVHGSALEADFSAGSRSELESYVAHHIPVLQAASWRNYEVTWANCRGNTRWNDWMKLPAACCEHCLTRFRTGLRVGKVWILNR